MFLSAAPNHLLGLNHFSATDSAFAPEFDYTSAVATIAVESDHRLMIAYNLPDSMSAGDGSVLRIVDEEAKLWIATPWTVVDRDANGNLVSIPIGPTPTPTPTPTRAQRLP